MTIWNSQSLWYPPVKHVVLEKLPIFLSMTFPSEPAFTGNFPACHVWWHRRVTNLKRAHCDGGGSATLAPKKNQKIYKNLLRNSPVIQSCRASRNHYTIPSRWHSRRHSQASPEIGWGTMAIAHCGYVVNSGLHKHLWSTLRSCRTAFSLKTR